MYKFNCQDQQILSKLFLLTIENIRLTKIIQSRSPSVHEDDNYVLNRIEQIQKQMGNQLKFKDQKIEELNSYIVQLHNLNQELSTKLDNLQINYKNLELASNSYIDTCIQNRDQTYSQAIEQHQYHIKVLQKEKEDIINQLQRLKNGLLKQYEADIQVLKKQNKSLITSLNNYRAEQLNSESDRLKFQEKNRQCINKLNEISLQKLFLEKEIEKKSAQIQDLKIMSASESEIQKKEIERLKEMTEENQQESRAEIQKLRIELADYKERIENFASDKQNVLKSKDEQIQQLNQKIKLFEAQSSKLKEQQRKNKEEMQKAYRKLRDYDRQYDLYVKKMQNTYLQMGRLKEENSHNACDYEAKSKQLKQYYEQSVQQIYSHCANLQLQNKSLKSSKEQLEQFYTEKQEKNSIKYINQARLFQKQIEQLKKQNDDHKKIVKELEKQKNDAVAQWKEIVDEMSKQKNIIHSFEQEIATYRNSIKNDIINKQRDRTQTDGVTRPDFDQKLQKDDESIGRMSQTNLRNQCPVSERKSEASFSYKSTQLTIPKNQLQKNKVMRAAHSYNKLKREYVQTVLSSARNDSLFYNYGQSTKIFKTNLIPDTQRPASLGQKTRQEINKKYEYLKKSGNESQEKKQVSSQYSKSFQKAISRRIPTQSYQSFTPNNHDKFEEKDTMGKMKRSNSVKYMKYDSKQSEIQQYLSFDIGNNTQFKAQMQKIQQYDRNYSQRMKTEEQLNSGPDKTFLIEKINKISSWRDSSQSNRFLKGTSFSKKPMMQIMNRGKEDSRAEKENLNEIISRKCRQIIQK